MPKSAKYLLVGSTEAYTGKTATVLGLGYLLQQKELDLHYGKLLGTCFADAEAKAQDADVAFIGQMLNLPASHIHQPLVLLHENQIQNRLRGEDQTPYDQRLRSQFQTQIDGDILLLEGPGSLEEGSLFNLGLAQIAEAIAASVLLVTHFDKALTVDVLLTAKRRLGDRLLGVLVNDITADQREDFDKTFAPFLESQGIPILGRLPRSNLLRSVSVGELVRQLQAEVLCRPDRLDLMVETLRIGAMNVNSALKYFRKGRNMAVVTGGDRTDIQLAALETSTQCLVLTGQMTLSEMVKSRAEELEIPILSVDLDTLTTVEIIDRAFGKVRLQEPIKVQCIQELMAEHFDIDRLLQLL